MRTDELRLKITSIAGAVLTLSALAGADSIYFRSGSGNAVEVQTSRITITTIERIDGVESIRFLTENGVARIKPIDVIIRIAVDGEPAFTQAETDFARGNYKEAADNYHKAMGVTTAEWIKRRADLRLLAISSKTRDFVGAVGRFIELAGKYPQGMAEHKPGVGGATPEQLTAAIASVNTAISNTNTATKGVLYSFLADLLNAKGDTAGANAAFDASSNPRGGWNAPRARRPHMIVPAGAAALPAPAEVPDPANKSGFARVESAIGARDFATALKLLEAMQPSLKSAPDRNLEKYYATEAKFGQLPQDAEPAELKALAESYLELAREFTDSDADSDGHYSVANREIIAARSTMRVAGILERLKQPAVALVLYQYVADKYPDPAKSTAKEAVARLTTRGAAKR